MKVAVYIEQGTTQLVFTPETEWEKDILKSIPQGARQTNVFRGGFYACNGGWIREATNSTDSVIIKFSKEALFPTV